MSEVTYGRLDEVLHSLGFSVRIVEAKARVYEHAETGALIAIPEQRLTKLVLPRHLGAVQATLEVFGIATPMEFTTSLQKAS
jgi:hypothetical protein